MSDDDQPSDVNDGPSIDDEHLMSLYQKMLEYTVELSENHHPFEVAGVMMAVSLALYRTGLNNDEYESMLETIFVKRGDISVFKPQYSH